MTHSTFPEPDGDRWHGAQTLVRGAVISEWRERECGDRKLIRSHRNSESRRWIEVREDPVESGEHCGGEYFHDHLLAFTLGFQLLRSRRNISLVLQMADVGQILSVSLSVRFHAQLLAQ